MTMEQGDRKAMAINVTMFFLFFMFFVVLSFFVGWWLLLGVLLALATMGAVAGIALIIYRVVYKALEHFDGL